MDFLWSLFSLRPQHRHYALLDKSGLCQAFRHCATPPIGFGWVEINEARLTWLHQPLPDSARFSPHAAHPGDRHLLTN